MRFWCNTIAGALRVSMFGRRLSVGAGIALGACGAMISACDAGEPTESTYNQVQFVTVRPDEAYIRVGNALMLQGTAVGTLGQIISKRFTWTSSNTAIATVSASGVVTGVGVGPVKITASADGYSGSSTVEILGAVPRNFSIVDAQFTQGVQAPDGTIPMLRGGSPAVVNVMLAANDIITAPTTQMVLRLFDANNALIRVDTATTGTLYVTTPTTALPTAQFLVPASVLQSGVRWQVERDPKHVNADANAADDIYPRTGTVALPVTDVPPIALRFIPIALITHNSQAILADSQLTDFTRTVESVLPIAGITRAIGPTLSTQAFFGAQPRGGELPFWSQVLSELDLARLVAGNDRSTYWIGVVRPPIGFTSTLFGGVGFIPTSGTATGAGSRATVLVGPNWYSSAAGARDGLAHELGHNFGRLHAPCGSVTSGVDASFPSTLGTIGVAGHDVYSWVKGITTFAPVVGTETGDIMGYCARPWSSPYTYSGALSFRRAGVVTAINASQIRERVLIVRGSVSDGQSPTLEPAFVATAIPSEPDAIGTYRLEGLDDAGRMLFARSFAPSVIDHAPGVGQFTFALPLSAATETSLATLRVSGAGQTPAIRQSVTSATSLSSVNSITAATAIATRNADGTVKVTCSAPYSAGILVLHRSNGMIAANSAASATFVAAGATPITVTCSDGVRSIVSEIAVP